jgi:hypothetical protein
VISSTNVCPFDIDVYTAQTARLAKIPEIFVGLAIAVIVESVAVQHLKVPIFLEC